MVASPDMVRLDERQFPAGAAVLARAFFPDPMFVALLPDAARREAVLPVICRTVLNFCGRDGECHTTAGEVRAVAAWVAPGAENSPERWAEAGLGEVAARLGEEGMERMSLLMEHMGRLRGR